MVTYAATMGHNAHQRLSLITPEAVAMYLERRGYTDVRALSLEPLGADVDQDLKAHGYGHPIRVSFESMGRRRDLVLRTMRSDAHGHDRRSDRLSALVLCMDTFNAVPKHTRASDVGAFDEAGQLISLPAGEPYLVTEYAPGQLYADDLARLRGANRAPIKDRSRAVLLADYLARLHSTPRPFRAYRRAIRDTIGHGEGIFGIIDTFPNLDSVPAERLQRIEQAAAAWRWKLRPHENRCRRTHGDFHPFNLLFTDQDDLTVLDCSRGAAGEPADDVTCLGINYMFFALAHSGRFDGALRELWSDFWTTYLERTEDTEVLTLVAPFFTWRALVLASPTWYPDLQESARHILLRFAERLLDGAPFLPDRVEELLK